MEDFSENRSLITSSDAVQPDQYDIVISFNVLSTCFSINGHQNKC